MNALNETHASAEASRQPLRILPGIVIATLLVLVRYVLPAIVPEGAFQDSLRESVCSEAWLARC